MINAKAAKVKTDIVNFHENIILIAEKIKKQAEKGEFILHEPMSEQIKDIFRSFGYIVDNANNIYWNDSRQNIFEEEKDIAAKAMQALADGINLKVFDQVNNLINQQIKHGEYHAMCDFYISNKVKVTLQNAGFKLYNDDKSNWIINWTNIEEDEYC